MKKLITTASLLALMAAGPAFAQSTSPSADPAKPSMGDTTSPSGPSTTTPGSTDGATDMQRSPSQETTPGSAQAPSMDPLNKSADAGSMSGQGLQVSELMGSAVRNTANESIGNINDILLTKDGQIDSVIVGVGGFLGLGEKNVALKFTELQFDNSNPNEPKVTSTATSDALAAAPEWKEPGSATGAGGTTGSR